MRIDTLTLKKFDPPQGGVGGYLLLKIFRDGPRPNLASMCGYILSPKKKFDPPHPRGFRGLNCLARLALARERMPSLIQNPFVLKAVRQTVVRLTVWTNQLCARFAFRGNVTLSTSMQRHYDESVHRIKQLTRGNNTIGFSDILSRIRNSTTTGSAVRVVYRGPFMSEDRSFDLSTAVRYVLFIADRSCRRIGVSTSR